MFKHYFEQIENVEVGPVISLVIFFVFFTLLIWRVFKTDRKYFDKMKNLPFDKKNESIPD